MFEALQTAFPIFLQRCFSTTAVCTGNKAPLRPLFYRHFRSLSSPDSLLFFDLGFLLFSAFFPLVSPASCNLCVSLSGLQSLAEKLTSSSKTYLELLLIWPCSLPYRQGADPLCDAVYVQLVKEELHSIKKREKAARRRILRATATRRDLKDAAVHTRYRF
ncbi:UNVERIFIED_CONTAM: hypothetical protein HHA_452620 [Hammondia hammondi]|eukprot:XP_008885816.1 hypothetical protein HHA_452620 [Hammondia hammondi]